MSAITDSPYYFSLSGIIVPILYYAVRRYLNQRKEESDKLQGIKEEQAKQEFKIENLKEQLNKIENGSK